MKMREIINEFFDNAIRVEKVIHIGTMCMDDAWPDIAAEAFEDEEGVWAALGVEEPDDVSTEAWSEAIRDACKLGFLVQFATPVPEGFYEDGYSFSWSWYSTQWIYGESFESARSEAMKWQVEFIEKRRAKEMEEQKQPPKGRN